MRSFFRWRIYLLLHRRQLIRHRQQGNASNWVFGSSRDIIRLCNEGRLRDALNILDKDCNISVNADTFASLLRLCNAGALSEVKRIHDHIVKHRLDRDVFLNNILIDAYGKCGAVEDAEGTFHRMNRRNVFSWTALIAAYSKDGQVKKALQLLQQMHWEGVMPDKVTFITMLKSCSNIVTLAEGRMVHACILFNCLELEIIVCNILINMYARCQGLDDAYEIFVKMVKRDVVSWNVIFAAFIEHERYKEALQLFRQMQHENIEPSKITFSTILNACSTSEALFIGKLIHAYMIDSTVESDVIGKTALVAMYGRCKSVENAKRMFEKITRKDVASYNAAISACCQDGDDIEAVQLFKEMHLDGLNPNQITFTTVLNACLSRNIGKLIHAYAIYGEADGKLGLDYVVGTALINMYGKCGSLEDARVLFDRIDQQDDISWSTMIASYAQQEYNKEALDILQEMKQEGLKPNKIALVSTFDACSNLADTAKGILIHKSIIGTGLELETSIENALINMYGKCGHLQTAQNIFDKMLDHSIVSWNTLIGSYAQHGREELASRLFKRMQLEHMMPNNVTLTNILYACSHGGQMDQGCYYFMSITHNYCLVPTVEHFGCMIDLLGRAGWMDCALDFVSRMPIQSNAIVWTALLASYRNHASFISLAPAAMAGAHINLS